VITFVGAARNVGNIVVRHQRQPPLSLLHLDYIAIEMITGVDHRVDAGPVAKYWPWVPRCSC